MAEAIASHFFEQEAAFARDLTPGQNRARRLKDARARLAALIARAAPKTIIENERRILRKLSGET